MVAIPHTVRLPIERQILPLKLMPPAIRPGVMLRSELQALLSEARVQPVTLVVAPAGYGKTTSLAQWAHELGRTGVQVSWLTLDSGDRDPGLFLAYLIRAFQRIMPGVGTDAWRTLNSAANLQRDWPLVAGMLCGDLQRQVHTTTFLMLDDLHLVVDSAVIAQILGYLVRAAPPLLHIVMASRRGPSFAPLGRLRTEGRLLELGQHDLQLTMEEAQELLSGQSIVLDEAELRALLERTEGWPLSLQLAARALQSLPQDERGNFVRDLNGRDEQLLDYLAVEVLSDLPQELLEFLRLASIPSYFDAQLLDQVLLREDSSYLLQRAQGLGLPIMPIDQQGGRLRFHTIWRELLLRGVEGLLNIETNTVLNRRFGHAFEQRGDLQSALEHYANAGAETELLRALRDHAWPLLQSPRRDMVRRWLDLLPEQLRDANPELLYMWGYSQIVGDPDRAAATIERAAELFRQANQPVRELRALSDLAALLFLEMRQSRFAAIAVRAIRAANRVRDVWSRGASLVCVAAMLYAKGRELAALRVARQAVVRPLNPAWHWLLAMIGATIELRLGRPEQAIAWVEAALQIPQLDDDDRLRQNLMRLHAEARFLQGFQVDATTAALAAHQQLLNYHRGGVVGESAQQLALMLMLQGRVDEATTYIAQARNAFHDLGLLAPLAALQTIELYGALVRGQSNRVVSMAATTVRRLEEADGNAPRLSLRLLLALVLGEAGEEPAALALTREIGRSMLERGYRTYLASAELYAAALAYKAGETSTAEEHLRAGWNVVSSDRMGFVPFMPGHLIDLVAEAAIRVGLDQAAIVTIVRRQASPDVLERIQALLSDSDPALRKRTAIVLGDLGAAVAYPALRGLLKDRSADVRRAAEEALGRLVYRPPYRLVVRTLGTFAIWRGDQEVKDRDWRSSKARQLFQVLLTERGRALPRDMVIDTLWPGMEPEAAANNLRVTINRLSKAIEPDRPEGAPPAYLIQHSETYSLNLDSDMEIDAVQFTSAVEEGRQAYARGQRRLAATALRRAVELYRGLYLPDCLYEDWSSVERERLALLFNEATLMLAGLLLDDGQIHEAIGLAWRAIESDRASEDAYRLLMRAHASLGERGTALRIYERCVAMLNEDLGVEPLPETQALYEQIKG